MDHKAVNTTWVRSSCAHDCQNVFDPRPDKAPIPCNKGSLQNAAGGIAPPAMQAPPTVLSTALPDELRISEANSCCCGALALAGFAMAPQLGLNICKLDGCRPMLSCSISAAAMGAELAEQKNGTYCTSIGLGLHIAVAEFCPPSML